MARPVCKGFCRDRRLISLLQRIRPRRSPPGQDGDTRAPVLINSSASCAVFNIRLPERRLTVRPSRRHPLANLVCTTGAFAPTERILRGHGYRPGVKRFPALQHRPGDPRQLVGQGDDHDIAMGPAHQRFINVSGSRARDQKGPSARPAAKARRPSGLVARAASMLSEGAPQSQRSGRGRISYSMRGRGRRRRCLLRLRRIDVARQFLMSRRRPPEG